MIKKTCLAIGVAIALVSSSVVGSEIDNKTKAEFCKSIVANLNRAMASYIMRDRADKEARRPIKNPNSCGFFTTVIPTLNQRKNEAT